MAAAERPEFSHYVDMLYSGTLAFAHRIHVGKATKTGRTMYDHLLVLFLLHVPLHANRK